MEIHGHEILQTTHCQAQLFKVGLRLPRVSVKFDFRSGSF